MPELLEIVWKYEVIEGATDKQLHALLEMNGIHRVNCEWFDLSSLKTKIDRQNYLSQMASQLPMKVKLLRKTKVGIYLDDIQLKMLDDIVVELNNNDNIKIETRSSVCLRIIVKRLKELVKVEQGSTKQIAAE